MSALFGGVENFTPAFTGQQIAIQAGSGAASAFTSGMNAGTSRKSQGLQQQKFNADQMMQGKQMEALDGWMNAWSNYLGSQ